MSALKMPHFRTLARLFPLVLLLIACPEPPNPPSVPHRTTPVPEKPAGRTAQHDDKVEQEDSQEIDKKSLLSGSILSRYSIPGGVRWIKQFSKPVTFIRWTPLGGLIVSVGKEVHNITSRGADRWRFVAGSGHRLFVVDSTEVVWAPAFNRLNELLFRGRTGWTRDWKGQLLTDERGGVYLVDASTVAALGPGGRDRWRVATEEVRKLEDTFSCPRGVLFKGSAGMQRYAIRISEHGSVVDKTVLRRGAVLVGAGPACEPLIWLDGEISLVDRHGKSIWQVEAPGLPFVHRLDGGFAMVHPRGGNKAQLTLIADNGAVVQKVDLPITGRLTTSAIRAVSGLDVDAIGLCLDVTSPCSRPSENRGPFNALLTSVDKRSFRVFLKHVQGHLNFATTENEMGLLIASSNDSDSTELTFRDAHHILLWQVTLPGRLSAGPYIGPSGEIYLGTCVNWNCEPPYRLVAITGKTPPPEDDTAGGEDETAAGD